MIKKKMRIKTGETSQIQHEALKSSAKVLLFSDIRKENRKIIFRAIFVEKKNYMFKKDIVFREQIFSTILQIFYSNNIWTIFGNICWEEEELHGNYMFKENYFCWQKSERCIETKNDTPKGCHVHSHSFIGRGLRVCRYR